MNVKPLILLYKHTFGKVMFDLKAKIAKQLRVKFGH